MEALIRCAEHVALADVAGRPLIERQIQWLQAIGCDRIVVESGSAAVRLHVNDVASAHAPDVTVALSLRDFPLEQVIRELELKGPVIIVPGDVLGDGDLVRTLVDCGSGGAVVHAPGPPVPGLSSATGLVRIWMPGVTVPDIEGPGWCCRLATEDDAHRLGCAALAHRLPTRDVPGHGWPIEIHAAEHERGVWIARGAYVAPTARLIGPVLIGPGAFVDARALVGPGVVVGPRAAVERGASVAYTTIPDAHVAATDGSVRPLARRRSA